MLFWCSVNITYCKPKTDAPRTGTSVLVPPMAPTARMALTAKLPHEAVECKYQHHWLRFGGRTRRDRRIYEALSVTYQPNEDGTPRTGASVRRGLFSTMGCTLGTRHRCTLFEGCTRAETPCSHALGNSFRYYFSVSSRIVASTVLRDHYAERLRAPPESHSFRPDHTTVDTIVLGFLLTFGRVGGRSTTTFSKVLILFPRRRFFH